MSNIFDFLFYLCGSIAIIIGIASIVAAITPSPKDNEWLEKFYKFLNLLALKFKK